MSGAAPSLDELASETEAEAARLDKELEEIELLIKQARTEVARHEQKRTQAEQRLTNAETRPQPVPAELREASGQLLAVARRASLMEAQIDILEGKQRSLGRFRDSMRALAGSMAELPGGTAPTDAGDIESSRAILEAQEDMRREIARQMHDGPAQSLTNIALQAQIVQRLVDRDPTRASVEVAQLVAMVQQTLDATKTFIFDVRPMVLDDLGLVPTLRRAARDRGRKAQVPVSFDSIGADRRIGNDLESGLFRIVDDAIGGYLSTRPARVEVRLDWTDHSLHASVRGFPADETPAPEALPAEPSGSREKGGGRGRRGGQEEMPAALARMIEEQKEGAAAASEAAASALAQARALPGPVWQQIQQRARTVEVAVDLEETGQRMVVVAQLA